jgi:hypothetical protein
MVYFQQLFQQAMPSQILVYIFKARQHPRMTKLACAVEAVLFSQGGQGFRNDQRVGHDVLQAQTAPNRQDDDGMVVIQQDTVRDQRKSILKLSVYQVGVRQPRNQQQRMFMPFADVVTNSRPPPLMVFMGTATVVVIIITTSTTV